MIGDSVTTALLQKALDGTWQRQRAISNNIANYETPGYKAKKVSFESMLEREANNLLKASSGSGNPAKDVEDIRQKILSLDIREYENNSTEARADGNNVDLDAENIEMAKTQIQYQYLTRSLSDTIARLRYAISEGRK